MTVFYATYALAALVVFGWFVLTVDPSSTNLGYAWLLPILWPLLVLLLLWHFAVQRWTGYGYHPRHKAGQHR